MRTYNWKISTVSCKWNSVFFCLGNFDKWHFSMTISWNSFSDILYWANTSLSASAIAAFELGCMHVRGLGYLIILHAFCDNANARSSLSTNRLDRLSDNLLNWKLLWSNFWKVCLSLVIDSKDTKEQLRLNQKYILSKPFNVLVEKYNRRFFQLKRTLKYSYSCNRLKKKIALFHPSRLHVSQLALKKRQTKN